MSCKFDYMKQRELLDYWVAVPFDDKRIIYFNTLTKEQILGKVNMDIINLNQQIISLKEYMPLEEIRKLNYIDSNNKTVNLNQWTDDLNKTLELNITLILGYQCNLSCSYCYEKEESHQIAISYNDDDNQFESSFIKFVESYITENNIKFVNIEFYGGEPFVYYQKMYSISSKLKQKLDLLNIELQIGIMSNGTLASKNKIESLMNFGLYKVEISLDGEMNMHNSRRPLKKKGNSFGQTISNIFEINDLIPIIIRVNVDHQNIESIKQMLIDLETLGLKKNISIYFTPVINCGESCDIKDDLKLMSSIGELYQIAGQLNFRFAVKYYAIGPCHIYKKSSFGITPDGDIYKCFPILETKCGNINSSGISIHDESSHKLDLSGKCLTCEYLPICFGGCKYANRNESQINNCPIDVFTSVLPHILKNNVFHCLKTNKLDYNM